MDIIKNNNIKNEIVSNEITNETTDDMKNIETNLEKNQIENNNLKNDFLKNENLENKICENLEDNNISNIVLDENYDNNENLEKDNFVLNQNSILLSQPIANENMSFFQKLKRFIKCKKEYFTVLGIFSCMFLLFLLLAGIFTKNNTILLGDSYEQIGGFFDHFYNVFDGKSPLFYSNYFGKGMEVFSTMQYMYTNPFYILVFLGGRNNIYPMFNLSFYLILAFNAIIFLWFINKYFKNLNFWTKIIFTLLYIFSGYVNSSYSFVTWLIYPALILLLVDRFIEFIKTGKITSFICIFIWYVISCYSVGISTSIILFVIFNLYILMTQDKETRHQKLTGLFVVFFVTAIASIVLLFPSILAILTSGRNESFLYNFFAGKNKNLFCKMHIIFASLAVLLFSLIYFIKCNKKENINKFYLVTFLILIAPTIFDSTLILLCLSRYQGFSCRFYFITEALTFFLALNLFDKKLINLKDCKTVPIYKYVYWLMNVVFILVFILYLYFFAYNLIGDVIKSPLETSTYSFILYLVLFIIISFFILLVLIFNKLQFFSKKLSKICIVFSLITSLSINFLLFSSCGGSSSLYRNEIRNLINSNDVDGSFKIKQNKYHEFLTNYSCEKLRKSSTFSSLVSNSTINSFEFLTYYSGPTVCEDDNGNLLSDCLTGINYYVSETEQDRPYLELISKSENFYLYKNILSSTGAFVLDSDFSFENDKTYFENMNKLKDYFSIEGNLFEDVELDPIEILEDEKMSNDLEDDLKKVKKYQFTAEKNGILYSNIYYNMVKEDFRMLKDIVGYQFQCTNDKILSEINYIKSGETYTFYFYSINDKFKFENINFKFLNYDVAEKLCLKIKELSANYSYEKDGYKVELNLTDSANLYVMTPDINGLDYALNEQKIEKNIVFNGMVYFSLNSGNFVLSAKYNYPYFKIWALVLICAILIISIVLTIYHFTKFKHIKFIIAKAMSVLTGIIFVLFYVFGIIISIINLFLFIT